MIEYIFFSILFGTKFRFVLCKMKPLQCTPFKQHWATGRNVVHCICNLLLIEEPLHAIVVDNRIVPSIFHLSNNLQLTPVLFKNIDDVYTNEKNETLKFAQRRKLKERAQFHQKLTHLFDSRNNVVKICKLFSKKCLCLLALDVTSQPHMALYKAHF